jgi:hypothetical protein
MTLRKVRCLFGHQWGEAGTGEALLRCERCGKERPAVENGSVREARDRAFETRGKDPMQNRPGGPFGR